MSFVVWGRRGQPRKLLLPDGEQANRDIFENLEDIRRQYPNDGDSQVEVIVHSSLEHGEYLVKPEAITRSVDRFCGSDAVLPLKKGNISTASSPRLNTELERL
ncbi:hypothetical protein V8C44DRAFT_315158 [Trichoderma aethiopicum]